jgi:HEAT repeat protein
VLVGLFPKNLETEYGFASFVASAIGEAADNDPKALDALVTAATFKTKNRPGYDTARDTFAEALGEIGKRHTETRPTIVPVLIKVAVNADGLGAAFRTRETAIEALGKFGPDAKAAVEPLRQLRLDADESVRRAASEALMAINP